MNPNEMGYSKDLEVEIRREALEKDGIRCVRQSNVGSNYLNRDGTKRNGGK